MAVEHRIDSPEAFASQFGVSRETIDRLRTYEDVLKRWQKTINLVAPATLPDIWHRHFADSAQIWGLSGRRDGHWLDLGSGAGFPGLVIAILAAEGGQTRHTFIESDSRKAAFLREAARSTGVAVDILCTRIESPRTVATVGAVQCVTARALAPLPKLAAWVAPFFSPQTVGFFLKGREVAAELEEARRAFELEARLVPSLTQADSRIVVVSQVKPKSTG